MTALYVTDAELRGALPSSSLDDVALANIAIGGASRSIDAYCGQRFWVPDAVTVRTYVSAGGALLNVDAIATATGLIVQTDSAGDGTYATTLTITTDYLLLPLNAPDMTPAAPYTQIWLPDSTFPSSSSGRPSVQVTALFGWPEIPDDVKAAALLLSRDLFKELKDAPFGVAGVAEFGVLRIHQNATARTLLGRYRRAMVA